MSEITRETIVRRIRALLAKTVAAGASEAEAMAAAAKAGALMAEHDLTYRDVSDVKDDRYGARKRPFRGGSQRRRTAHEVNNCVMYVAAFFDCKCWISGADLVFFGSEHDTELAHGMVDLLRVAMDLAWSRYLKSDARDPYEHGRTLRASFMLGMARRINERLRALKRERSQAAQTLSTGTSLVVVKERVIQEKFATYSAQAGLNLRAQTRRPSVGSDGAYQAGQAAGSRVDLGGAKITGDGQPRLR